MKDCDNDIARVKFFFCFLFFFVSHLYAVPIQNVNIESETSRFSKDYNNEKKDLLFVFFGLANDNYYKLDKFPKFRVYGHDFGQTHGMSLGTLYKEYKRGREYAVNFDTGLYTRYVNAYYDENDRPTVAQEFREITTLDFSFMDPRRGNYYYFRYLLGFGLINDKKPIFPLALWQQSGAHGDGGFHKMIGIKTRLQDQSTGGREYFLSSGWSIGRYIPLDEYFDLSKRWGWMNFTLESGFIVRTITEGNSVFALLRTNYPLVKSEAIVTGKGFLDLNLQLQTTYYPHENAAGISYLAGLQMNFQTWGVLLNMVDYSGNQNPSFFKYTDNDPLFTLLLFTMF